MRKTELFNSYLEGTLSIEQKEKLKAILRTEQGSEDFAKFMAESKVMCDLLDKREQTKSVTNRQRTNKKSKKFNPFILLVPALAAALAIVFLIKPPQKPSSFTYVDKSKTIILGETLKTESPLKIQTKNKSLLTVNRGSIKVISDNEVFIKNGNFDFKMNKQPADTPFVINSQSGTVRILGTAFKIIDSGQESFIKVTEGKVHVVTGNGEDEVYLTAGMSRYYSKKGISRKSINLQDKLEASYNFNQHSDNEVKDLSGNNRTAISRKGATVKEDEGNKAGFFSGESHYALPKIDIEGAYSLSAWIKLNGKIKPWQAIITNGDKSWRLSLFDEGFKAHFCGTGLSSEYVNSKNEVKIGEWTLLTGVYDGTSLKVFINGKLENTQEVTGKVNKSPYQLEIGGNNQAHFRNFEGMIDGVLIYSRALSDDEVEQLYIKGRP